MVLVHIVRNDLLAKMSTCQAWGQIHQKVFQLQIQILFKMQNTNTFFLIVFEIQIQNTSNVLKFC